MSTLDASKSSAQFPEIEASFGGVRVLSATGELFNHVDEGLPMWSESGDRSVVHSVVFSKPFASKPAIVLGLSGIDSAHDQNLRFRLNYGNVSETGFDIEFLTWEDTHIARASVSWQATGPAAKEETKPQPLPQPARPRAAASSGTRAGSASAGKSKT